MTAQIAPPPFQLDVRVAESPLTGMRYLLNGRVADLDDVVSSLEESLDRERSVRAALRTRLKRLENSRRNLLGAENRSNGELRRCLEESLVLRDELAACEERMDSIKQRADGMRAQRETLREVSELLASTPSTGLDSGSLDSDAVRTNQALRQLTQIADDDAEHVARDILQGPMQLLADAMLHTELVGRVVGQTPAEAAESVSRCRDATRAALRELNRIVFQLRPRVLEEDGLVAVLRELVRDLSEHSAVRLHVVGGEQRLAGATELALFRIVQEAVINGLEHGHAGHIDVILAYHADKVLVVIRDDGEGFDVIATEAGMGRNRAVGILAMRQRAELEGGTVEIRSLVGEGTEVRATFPH